MNVPASSVAPGDRTGSSAAPIADHNRLLLEQGIELLARLSAEDYARIPRELSRGGVGAHFRHILDHYDCLLDGIEAGGVDYDRRERDEATERDPRHAAARIRVLLARLDALAEADARRSLRVAMDSGERERQDQGWTVSTLGRELQYLLAHTVHHYALVGVILRLCGIEPGLDFGVAPSTLRHERDGRPGPAERS